MTRRRKFIGGAAVVVVGLMAWTMVRGPAPLEVEAATVRRDTVRVTVEEEGVTRARDRYAIASPISGRLARITIREGDPVAEGQVVARVFPAPEDARVVSAMRAAATAAEARRAEVAARVAEASGQYEQAEREAARRRRLVDSGALSRETVEQAELAAASAAKRLEAAESALQAADADVTAARAQLVGADAGAGRGQPVTVQAPVAGRVLRVLEKSERVVLAGTPLIEVADAQGMEVVIDVLSEDAVPIEPGQPMIITEWGGEPQIRGVVRLVEPDAFTKISALGVEEQRVNVVADLLHAPAALGTGYRVQASVVTWQADDVLAVPSAALFRSGPAWQVFAIVDGRARLREVQVGHRGRAAAEITAGLEPGDVVILYPSDQIADGVRVRAASGP